MTKSGDRTPTRKRRTPWKPAVPGSTRVGYDEATRRLLIWDDKDETWQPRIADSEHAMVAHIWAMKTRTAPRWERGRDLLRELSSRPHREWGVDVSDADTRSASDLAGDLLTALDYMEDAWRCGSNEHFALVRGIGKRNLLVTASIEALRFEEGMTPLRDDHSRAATWMLTLKALGIAERIGFDKDTLLHSRAVELLPPTPRPQDHVRSASTERLPRMMPKYVRWSVAEVVSKQNEEAKTGGVVVVDTWSDLGATATTSATCLELHSLSEGDILRSPFSGRVISSHVADEGSPHSRRELLIGLGGAVITVRLAPSHKILVRGGAIQAGDPLIRVTRGGSVHRTDPKASGSQVEIAARGSSQPLRWPVTEREILQRSPRLVRPLAKEGISIRLVT